jgi:hypothetical protein
MRTLFKLLAATAAVAIAPAAQAATILPDNPGGVPGAYFNVSGDINSGPISATFGRSGIGVGTFTDDFVFRIDQMGLGSGSITTILAGIAGSATDLDFDMVTFSNGTSTFPVLTVDTGFQESGGLSNIPIMSGALNTLSVTYTSRGQGSFGGNLSFAPTISAIPEPSTWAMMILGFGAVGVALRRRRKDEVRVGYAF